jgi:ParB-like chromosome segregation protein Spo0J
MKQTKNAEKIEKIAIGKLKPYEQNSKMHPGDQVDKIARSIEQFGFRIPLLIDKNNEIISGHGRYLAAMKLGIEAVPCIRAKNLSTEQIKAFRIADNKVAESAWDEELLTQEMIELFEADFDLGMTGFSEKELKDLLKDFDHETRGKEKLAQRRKGAKKKPLKLKEKYEYQIIVECRGEAQQTKLIERFKGEGLKCRAKNNRSH